MTVLRWPAASQEPLWGIIYFASGASALGDLRGLARVAHPLGVCLPELGAQSVRALKDLAGWTMPLIERPGAEPRAVPLPIFVDTGAFGEVEETEAGIVVARPIDERSWGERMALLLELARHRRARTLRRGPSRRRRRVHWGDQLARQIYAVAPDCVGDQAETLRRMRRWRHVMMEVRRRGARIVVPIQRGAMPQAAFDRAAARALGFADFIRGIPSNKDAMPVDDLERYLIAIRPPAVHFLGLGPRGARFNELVNVVRRLAPGAAISCDSNPIPAMVGRTNGPAGQPRALTLLQAQFGAREHDAADARENAVVMALGVGTVLRRAKEAGLLGPARERPLQPGLFDQLLKGS
ncbi:MAG: hypothetical protein ACTHU0_21515 [Kofleriaceae bacterium]